MSRPMIKFFFLGIVLLMTHLSANNSFNSEISHVAGGVVMASAITAVADHYPEYRNNRGIIGFGVSSASIVFFESVSIASNGDAKGQFIDIVSHIVGSALGAAATDSYLLSPVIQTSTMEGNYLGLKLEYSC